MLHSIHTSPHKASVSNRGSGAPLLSSTVGWIALELHHLLQGIDGVETHAVPAPPQGSQQSVDDESPICAKHHACSFHEAVHKVSMPHEAFSMACPC